ncbi:MAG: hypothetical protein LBR81_08435 [Prevotellaceae bacterium]|jgi:hypothetical protein|nr:hypothetical protein [Prevotellaceae bacterium]
MKKAFLSLSLLLSLGLTSVVAQDYAGTYLGTLTLNPTVFTLGDASDINLEIPNQELQVSTNLVGLYQIPVFKSSDPVNIGFPQAEFAQNGDISAPNIDGSTGGVPVTFSVISGNISGNTINFVFRMVDKETGGTHADITATYTGTKQSSSGIDDALRAGKTVAGIYSITGQELNEKPQSGVYIIVYDNGTTEKVMKK